MLLCLSDLQDRRTVPNRSGWVHEKLGPPSGLKRWDGRPHSSVWYGLCCGLFCPVQRPKATVFRGVR
jgi:hypothetical protein